MSVLASPNGIFDLSNSDRHVGSYFKKTDIKEILKLEDRSLDGIKFELVDGLEVIDERILQKLIYHKKILHYDIHNRASVDEIILAAIIKRAYPHAEIEFQVRVKRFAMDLKIEAENKTVFVEFDGPGHFIFSRYGIPRDPFEKKKRVEDITGVECVKWPYWVQRCERNVIVIFNREIHGLGALWSTNVHYGMFYFDNSAEIIDAISNRFSIRRDNSYGYMYEENSEGRVKPEHPIIKEIIEDKRSKQILIPKGSADLNKWLPKCLL